MLRRSIAMSTIVVSALAYPGRGASARTPSPGGVASATDSAGSWLGSKQRTSGAFFVDQAPAHEVMEAAVSVKASRGPIDSVDRALSYVSHPSTPGADTGGRAGRVVLSLVALGKDPRSWAGTDHVARLQSFYDPATGSYDTRNLYSNALGVLGAMSAGIDLDPRAVTYMEANACPDGGFSYQIGCLGAKADTDTSAMVLMALHRAGSTKASSVRSFLVSSLNPDGGFGFNRGQRTNTNSTALALSAIAALREDPTQKPWTSADGANPRQRLMSLQVRSGADAGAFLYEDGADDSRKNFATVQAIPGLLGLALPLAPSDLPSPLGAKPVPSQGTSSASERVLTNPQSIAPTAAPTARPPVAAPRGPSDADTPAIRRVGHDRLLADTSPRSSPEPLRWLSVISLASVSAAMLIRKKR